MFETRRGKFVSVHGIDGTGKTSTAQAVVDKLEVIGVPSVNYDILRSQNGSPLGEKKKEIDRTGTLEDRLAVYLESMMYHGEAIEALLAQGFHVVKSRYLDDVCAHFAHLGISQEKIEEFKKKFPMVQPDLKVILQLTEAERRRRINTTREVLNDNDLDEKMPGSRAYFFEDYLLKAAQVAPLGSVLHVDTGECDTDAVARKIIDHMLAGIKK